jgi:hypothetical protein
VAGILILANKVVSIPDEMLTMKLVDLWSFFFGTVIPYMQGIFLPVKTKLKSVSTQINMNPYHAKKDSAVSFNLKKILILSFRDVILVPMSGRFEGSFI